MKNKKLILTVCICLLATIIAVVFLFPRHPQPEYSVETYEELAEKLDGQCVLPAQDTLPHTDVSYTVYLESRFSNDVVGYIIGYNATKTGTTEMTISCKALKELDEVIELTPTATYNSVELEITENSVSFEMSDYRYMIYYDANSEELQQVAILIAENFIDNTTK